METRKGAQTVFNIQYHVVWVTRYHYHVLVGEVKQRTREIIRQVCLQRELSILQGHVSKDHIHLLVSAPSPIAASVVMQKVKGRSSRVLQQEFPHLRKRYWGQPSWARGYFCVTVGQVTDEMIQKYIAGHVEKSKNKRNTPDKLEPKKLWPCRSKGRRLQRNQDQVASKRHRTLQRARPGLGRARL